MGLPSANLFWRSRPTLAVVVFLATMIASHYLRRFIPADVTNSAWRDNLLTMSHFFIAGILYALYGRMLLAKTHIFWCAAVPAAMAVFLYVQLIGHQVLTHLLPLALTTLVLAAAKASALLGRKAPSGDLSYDIYLYHFPVVTVARIVDARCDTAFSSIWPLISITVLASLLSWHLIETRAFDGPILRLLAVTEPASGQCRR